MIIEDLDKLTREVTHREGDHGTVLERLEDAHRKHGGYGLAANQIGIFDSRTCIVDVLEKVPLINPTIVDREGETVTTEGCLSIPGERVETKRNVWVTVEADNFEGRLHFGPAHENDENSDKYMESIAVQHEIDHLNGLTIFDREIERKPFEKSELQTLGRNDKVHVENENGEEFEVKWKHASKHEDWEVLDII